MYLCVAELLLSSREPDFTRSWWLSSANYSQKQQTCLVQMTAAITYRLSVGNRWLAERTLVTVVLAFTLSPAEISVIKLARNS